MGMGISIGVGIGMGGGLPFSPLQLSGLKAWYDASQETGYANTDPVPSVTDWSGNGNHCVQAVAAQQPTFRTNVQNSLPIYRFDGSNDRVAAAFTLARPSYRFMVFKLVASNPGGQASIANGIADDTAAMFFSTGTTADLNIFSGAVGSVIFTPYGTSVFRRSVVCYGENQRKYAVSADAITENASNCAATVDGVTLGGRPDGNGYAQCDIAECIVGAGMLGNATITAAMDYLKTKWSVT